VVKRRSTLSRRSQVEAQRRAARRRWLLIAIVAAVVVGAAIGAVVATSGGGGGSSKVALSSQTKPVIIDGAPLPPLTDASSDPAVGMTLPTLSGQTFDGSPVLIKPDGKAKVVLGIAHWCPHCQREVPLLSANLRSNPLPSSVEMVSISTSVQPSAPNYPPQAWLTRVHWPVPVLADDTKGTAANAIGLSSFPFFVFVDAQGKVVSRSAGEMPVTQFRAMVDRLAAGGTPAP
jgi:cytochrome c biogenesis protein CcmG/thiol:disulfide interchange protein DsbE